MLCLLLGLVCHVAWAQTSEDGPIVTFTNVQQDGTTYTLYINNDNVLATSAESVETLGDAAKFRATLQANGTYTFYNETKGLYMIWRGKGEGHNSDKGVLSEYDETFCNWTLASGNAKKVGTYYFYAKRNNPSKDGTLVLMDSGGAFDGWDNSIAWSGTYSNLYNIESDEYTATLTGSEGTVLTCSTKGFPAPTYSNATLSDMVWKGGNLTATVSVALPVLAFPVSSTEATNATLVSSFINGGGDYSGAGRFKWYADGSDVKVQRDATVTQANAASYSWAIYATLENGVIYYSIKNIATGKYIYTTASFTNNSGSHGQGTISLSDTPTKFLCTTDGKNRFYYVSNNVNQYLSLNSVNDATGNVGVYAKAHDGTTISFHIPTYPLTDKEGFVNGGIYTFVSSKGWMGANERDIVISTARTTVTPTASASNINFQWTVYKSNNGNYYLYNIGKQKFMGVQSSNNADIPFVDSPAGKKLTFKQSGSAEYPIMFSTDNAGVVNHNPNHGGGLINWTGGWNNLNDDGSNHKVNALVITLTADELKSIADLVEAYDRKLPITAEVEGLPEGNPNTHYGSVIATNASTYSYKVLKDVNDDVVYLYYDGTKETTISFDREYRGFEFQGFYLDGEKLDDSFILTDELKERITEETPLVAKVKFNGTNEVTLFSDDDEFSYRIPAIATTETGRIIAVSDYRHSLDDIGRYNFGTATPGIDLVIRTSDDNGKTWSETKTIAKGSGVRGADNCAYGDAAIAVVGEKVLVMAAAGDVMFGNGSATAHNRAVRVFSADNGATWNKQDISETLFLGDNATIQNGYTAFFGSGKLAVDKNYNNTGNARIYGAMLIKKEGYNNAIYVVYTDDLGITWSILGDSQIPVTTNDEPKVEILPSGQILLSVRRNGGRQFNVFTYTNKATNTGSWNSNVNGCGNGGSNTCNGEPFLVDAKNANGDAVKLLLQSQPKGGSGLYDRRDVTIWYKEVSATETYTSQQIADGWTQGLQVSNQQSAYSAMALQQDGKIAFFFEEAPCYGDDQAKGYCMVYVPLTIENVTKGNYFAPDTDLSKDQVVNVVLTDAQGNEYRDQLTCALNGTAGAVTTKYPFITLGGNAAIEYDGAAYTYTNTVTLPFKVSNEETTVWHNIYIPSNTTTRYPVYFYSESDAATVKSRAASVDYGSSDDYNTQEHADNMSWAIYSVDNGFTFVFKNKLTDKYIKVSEPASNRNENVQYDTRENATAFSIEKNANYKGDYIIKHGAGHLSVYGATDGYLTFYNGNYHWGSTAKIVEAPDFEALIAEVNEVLDMFGNGLGQYSGVSEENLAAVNTAKEKMESASSVKLNTLTEYQGYTSKTNGCTLNMPKAGQFFRIRGISGNYIDATSIHDNASATTGQMSMKSADACNYNGTVFYLDEEKHLLNYATGTYVKQTCEIAAVGDTDKAIWNVTESPRKGGKYALQNSVVSGQNGRHLHDSDGNRADRDASNCGERHDFTLEEVTALPVTIGSVGYATLYAPVALEIPEGVAAYVGTLNDDETELTLTEVEDVIPAETGVVLYRAEGTASTTHHFDATDDVEDIETDFVGSIATIAKSGTPYTLQTHNGGVAFKRYTGDNISGFKAYLNLTTNSAEAQAIRIRFAGEEDDTTGIESSVLDAQGSQLIYDLQGRRVLNPTKGMYIVNGKKVVIK